MIEYERLVGDYKNNLMTTLRNHSAGADYLETWVPDDDHLKSLVNMIEAAQAHGEDRIEIAVGPQIAAALDAPALIDTAAKLGTVAITPRSNGLLIGVTGLKNGSARPEPRPATLSRGKASPRRAPERRGGKRLQGPSAPRTGAADAPVHPSYGESLECAARRIRHQHALAPVDEVVEVEIDGVRLSALIDRDGYVIREAAHAGATDRLQRAALDRLCDIVAGLPVQEAAEHAGIRLEYELRDTTVAPPVAGIVQPENVDPIFRLPVALCRALMRACAETAGLHRGENFFDAPPAESWARMSHDARLKALRDEIDRVCRDRGWPADDVEIVEVKDLVKVTLAFHGMLAASDKQPVIWRLERAFKRLERSVHVFMDELKDQNKIRRL